MAPAPSKGSPDRRPLDTDIVIGVVKSLLECVICRNIMSNPQTLRCSHTFCLKCVEKWLEEQGKAECPLCRNRINMDEMVKCEALERLVNMFFTLNTNDKDYAALTGSDIAWRREVCVMKMMRKRRHHEFHLEHCDHLGCIAQRHPMDLPSSPVAVGPADGQFANRFHFFTEENDVVRMVPAGDVHEEGAASDEELMGADGGDVQPVVQVQEEFMSVKSA